MAESVAELVGDRPTATSSALGLKRQISTPGSRKARRCGPEGIYLRASDGLIVPMPCGCVNGCDVCATRKRWEAAEMLCIDAMEGSAPTVWACLGSRLTNPDPAQFWRAREKVIRALRRRWSGCEYVAMFEMTTGYGARSGGKRRPHFHLLFKGIPSEDAAQAFEIAARVWCGQLNARLASEEIPVPAEIGAQRGGEVTAAPGLIRYITAHFGKDAQRPPDGWKGKREVRSLGYFSEPVEALRKRARESIYRRRAVHRLQRRGLAGDDLELELAAQVLARAQRQWAWYSGDEDPDSYFFYEAERVRGKWGGWKGARGAPRPYDARQMSSLTTTGAVPAAAEPDALPF